MGDSATNAASLASFSGGLDTTTHTRVASVQDDERALRVALLGGVPGLLGGGGLELQVRHTAAALRRRGHDARAVVEAPPDWEFDVLHVVGHTADVGHVLHHWRRHPARLVVSPVLVVPPAREWRLKLGTRLPIPAFEPRVLRALVERADHLVALTRWEASFLLKVGGSRTAPVTVIGNGVDGSPGTTRIDAVEGAPLPPDYVLTVGAVSERKRQLEIARALRGVAPYVVVGGWDGAGRDREAFEEAVRATGGCWLGEVTDRELLLGVVASAGALVHLSEAEGQSLAVLEALSVGTRCILSDLPQQRELAQAFPDWVALVESDDGIAPALARLDVDAPQAPPRIPSWDDVAADLGQVYATAMQRPATLWSDRV